MMKEQGLLNKMVLVLLKFLQKQVFAYKMYYLILTKAFKKSAEFILEEIATESIDLNLSVNIDNIKVSKHKKEKFN